MIMSIRYWLLMLLLAITTGSMGAAEVKRTRALSTGDMDSELVLGEHEMTFGEPSKMKVAKEKVESKTKQAVEGGKDIARQAAETVKEGLAKARTWIAETWSSLTGKAGKGQTTTTMKTTTTDL
jgi:hypothetical protein